MFKMLAMAGKRAKYFTLDLLIAHPLFFTFKINYVSFLMTDDVKDISNE